MKNTEDIYLQYMFNRAGKAGRPLSGTFEITSRCNLQCKMCYIHRSNCEEIRKQELPASEWKRIADELYDSGVLMMLITGGEPLIREDFTEIFLYLKKRGFNVQLNTNGTMITDEIIELFKEYPPSRISISIYGASEETYQRLTGKKGMYEKAINGALALKNAGLQVKISLTATQYNRDDIPAIYDWAKENGFHVQAANYMFPAVRSDGVTDRASPEEAAEIGLICERSNYGEEEFAKRMKLILDGKKPEINEEITDDIGERIWCRAGKSTFWITWKGDLTPCGMMEEPKFSLLKMSFEEAWKKAHDATEKMFLPSECKNCTYRYICDICAAGCKAETGAYDKVPYYICAKTKARFNLIKEEFGNAENK